MYPNLTNEHDRKGTFLKGTMSEIYGSQTPSYLAHTGFFAGNQYNARYTKEDVVQIQ